MDSVEAARKVARALAYPSPASYLDAAVDSATLATGGASACFGASSSFTGSVLLGFVPTYALFFATYAYAPAFSIGRSEGPVLLKSLGTPFSLRAIVSPR